MTVTFFINIAYGNFVFQPVQFFHQCEIGRHPVYQSSIVRHLEKLIHFICRESSYLNYLWISHFHSIIFQLESGFLNSYRQINKLEYHAIHMYVSGVHCQFALTLKHSEKQLIVASLYVYPSSRVPDIAICIS